MEAVSRENTPRYIDVEGHDPADAPQEGPSPHRGEQGLSGGGYLFNGPSETGESTMQQPSHATRVSQDGGGAKDSLYLQEDQQAENPLAPPQPLSAAVEPSPEDTRGREGASVSLGPPQGPGEHHFQENSERQGPPKTSSESAAAAARNTLKRATTTMREGVKTASAQVVHAGEKTAAQTLPHITQHLLQQVKHLQQQQQQQQQQQRQQQQQQRQQLQQQQQQDNLKKNRCYQV
ncbi:hypothetical protein, conserved [Eimeria praecox]|uniref:Uncharacterized protein n=1 Tax=Eimeria praecox TaxID=51316 RepID=U6H6J2_9EIME|nr:hypothetical protein, conserved [Eimeria praecox]